MTSDLDGFLKAANTAQGVSHWTQYLCVRRVRPGLAAVEICKYEVLCDFSPYDEDDNPVEIPREMDGKKVIGFEDGFLVGGSWALKTTIVRTNNGNM